MGAPLYTLWPRPALPRPALPRGGVPSGARVRCDRLRPIQSPYVCTACPCCGPTWPLLYTLLSWRGGGYCCPHDSTKSCSKRRAGGPLLFLLAMSWGACIARSCAAASALCRRLPCHATALPTKVSGASCAHPSHTLPQWDNARWAHGAPAMCWNQSRRRRMDVTCHSTQCSSGLLRRWTRSLNMRCVSVESRYTIVWLQAAADGKHRCRSLFPPRPSQPERAGPDEERLVLAKSRRTAQILSSTLSEPRIMPKIRSGLHGRPSACNLDLLGHCC